ncbi:hypothetical protein SAMN05444167_1653 [Terriglobus roseus]|uniref:Uncharacterized protein n=1 Tax=Terriglobus roseus TaxID=392734 RepID=A0A1G7J2B4_9BACT|nr:hypothetical protein SAMN05444167_1653 [Terriglobus roseus]
MVAELSAMQCSKGSGNGRSSDPGGRKPRTAIRTQANYTEYALSDVVYVNGFFT